ncbi:MAG: hypothetical protein CMF39_02845 [Legionellaceae bacterium]|nr:hypothetical protein [Legionellaceae bacterium]
MPLSIESVFRIFNLRSPRNMSASRDYLEREGLSPPTAEAEKPKDAFSWRFDAISEERYPRFVSALKTAAQAADPNVRFESVCADAHMFYIHFSRPKSYEKFWHSALPGEENLGKVTLSIETLATVNGQSVKAVKLTGDIVTGELFDASFAARDADYKQIRVTTAPSYQNPDEMYFKKAGRCPARLLQTFKETLKSDPALAERYRTNYGGPPAEPVPLIGPASAPASSLLGAGAARDERHAEPSQETRADMK